MLPFFRPRGAAPGASPGAAKGFSFRALLVFGCLVACAVPAQAEEAAGSQADIAADDDDASDVQSVADTEPDPLFDDLFDEDFDEDPAGYPDPLEETNRGTFAFNRQVDRFLLDPVTEAYRFVVPEFGRKAIARVFANLGSTKTLVNDVLQLEWKDASVTTGRLVVNSTIGLAGLFDVAAEMGLEAHESDFGQTLALAGTPSGPYLVLPVLGPATIRDGFGTIVDGFFQPTYYILGPSNVILGPTEIILYTGSSGISTRDRHYLELKSLEDSSVDFYAAMRSGFYQDRVAHIWTRRPGHRTTEEPVFTFDGESYEIDDADIDRP